MTTGRKLKMGTNYDENNISMGFLFGVYSLNQERKEKKKKHRRRTHYDPWKGHRVSAVVWWVSEQLQRGSAQKGHHWQRWVSYYFWLGAGMGVTLYSKFQVSLRPMENKKKIQILLIQAAAGYSRKLLPFLPLGKKGPRSIWLTIWSHCVPSLNCAGLHRCLLHLIKTPWSSVFRLAY